MPTKHIDDATAAQLDDLYVRCVTLTQQPVKEVEVLRLAIQTGIGNISDNDILASMAVKATVWERLAGDVWTEVTKEWPAAGIHSKNFNEMAERHSPLWKTFTSNVCRDAIRSVLKRDLENNLLNDLFGWSEAFTEEEKEREEKERKGIKKIKNTGNLCTSWTAGYIHRCQSRNKTLQSIIVSTARLSASPLTERTISRFRYS
ncbi:TPA: hypothetical protein MYL59_004013 [Klebsiella variicola subsp. variicola]|nr:hypothetical protein [Klebsiella variicola subsp. variicola]